MINFEIVPEFEDDLEHLLIRFSSLRKDLERLKDVLKLKGPKMTPGTVRISHLGAGVIDPIYKVRHFRCESLKGKGSRSGIRVILGHNESTGKITLIQIYHKSETENEDRERIKRYFE